MTQNFWFVGGKGGDGYKGNYSLTASKINYFLFCASKIR